MSANVPPDDTTLGRVGEQQKRGHGFTRTTVLLTKTEAMAKSAENAGLAATQESLQFLDLVVGQVEVVPGPLGIG